MQAARLTNPARLAVLLAAVVAAAACGAAAPTDIQLTVHLGQPPGEPSPLLYGHVLPGPGMEGAHGLLPQLLRNRSFETTPPGKAQPIPKEWGKAAGWQLLSCGPKRILVRHTHGLGDALLLAPRTRWNEYALTLIARKTGGPGGLCVLFEVKDADTHLRWTLGAMGNQYHVLEKVKGGEAERLGPPVVGGIEAGRCYRIEVRRREREIRFLLNGRLIHHVRRLRMRFGGIGLAGAGATAEYLDLTVHGRHQTPRFLLDDPAESQRISISAGWEPLLDPRNEVAYRWDSLYPFNSHFCQSIKVQKFAGGDAGIRQRGLAVEAGKAYRGRVHLRAQGRAAVVVSLRGPDGKVLASQQLGEPPETWKAYEFVLRPAAACRAADFCIVAAARSTVWVDQVSLAREGTASPYGLRDSVVQALRRLKPAVLRWPGEAIGHNWRRGIGPPDERPVASAADGGTATFVPAPNDFGTVEFLELCRHLGAQPILTIGPRLGLRPALYWLEYCNGEANTRWGKLRAEHGVVEPYGVKLWAVGGVPLADFDAKQYGETAGRIVGAMREQDPTVRVIPLLVGGCARRELVAVKARGAPSPARLQVWAARSGAKLAVRLVHLGEGKTEATVTVEGLKKGRLAGEAEHWSMDFPGESGATEIVRAKLKVSGSVVRLSLRPRATHVVVLRLEER